jgi:hypothetical protein
MAQQETDDVSHFAAIPVREMISLATKSDATLSHRRDHGTSSPEAGDKMAAWPAARRHGGTAATLWKAWRMRR